jgi:pyrimidine operon attenuation protein/uracil phosphoribosyltransferase
MNIDIDKALEQMAGELGGLCEIRNLCNPLMIGIHSGGVWIAQRLHAALKLEEDLGTLDISFYRDDFTRIGMNPQVRPSNLPFSVDGRNIILVDDVLYTGRTIRAALNEIFDYGRPAAVVLAVLVDRGGRELPIQADVTGVHLQLGEDEQVKLSGPDPLTLEKQSVEET